MTRDAWAARRTPGEGRYARPEYERRFLVAGEAACGGAPRQIVDRYLDGTRLRLRKQVVGDDAVFKLTQKVRHDEGDPALVALTNIYLSLQEYEQIAALPARVLTKTRRVCEFEGQLFVVDEFHGRLAGLRLAEVEVKDLQAPFRLPPWVGEAVTHDERFSGGYLARANSIQVAEVLSRMPDRDGSRIADAGD